MKKILHLSHTDIRSDSRILKEMYALSKVGYNVSGIGVMLDEATVQSDYQKDFEIDSVCLRSRALKFLPRAIYHFFTIIELTIKMIFKAYKVRADVIHCNDTVVLPLGVIIKLLTRSRLIYDAHELESNRNGLTKMLGRITLFTEKILWRFIDALIVVSPSIQQWYANNIGNKKSEVILNSPVISDIEPEGKTSYLRQRFNIAKDSKVFIYVGILAEGRGIDLLVEAFKREEITSSIVFLGYGEMAEQLQETAMNHPNIYFHEAIPHEKVVSIAKSADIGLCLIQNVSLSDYYCLPNKLFEYCFAGIPVLASNFPDIVNVVTKFNLGTTCDIEEKSIVEAIKSYQSDQIKTNFDPEDLYELSWEAQEEKLQKLYTSLLKN